MRGIDTNGLLRMAVLDDEGQARLVERFVDRLQRDQELLYVNSVALCEFVWVLRSRYRYRKPQIVKAVEELLLLDLVVPEHPDAFQRALASYRDGPADFADYLIGAINVQAGCRDSVTFDRRLNRADGFTRLG